MLNMERLTGHLKGEKQFTILDANTTGLTEQELKDAGYPFEIKVHPWARKRGRNRIDREVAVSIRYTDPDPDELEDEQIIIVDRDEFIEGILFAFPELCYNHDDEEN